jgi:GLPGLI family protein
LKKQQIILFCFIALFYLGCDSGLFDKRISEGIIEYEVTYPALDPNDMLAGLMPGTMTLKFKDNKFNTELSAGMGMFKTNFISNSNDYTLINSVKLINKKYATLLHKKDVEKANEKFKNINIIKSDETKEIAGYMCKKAVIVFDDIDMGEFYVYYTDQIKFNDPNWGTPFKDINGIMLEYQMVKYNILMTFTAKSVKKAEVDDAEFKIPDDYEFIPIEDLDKEINNIFDTFK